MTNYAHWQKLGNCFNVKSEIDERLKKLRQWPLESLPLGVCLKELDDSIIEFPTPATQIYYNLQTLPTAACGLAPLGIPAARAHGFRQSLPHLASRWEATEERLKRPTNPFSTPTENWNKCLRIVCGKIDPKKMLTCEWCLTSLLKPERLLIKHVKTSIGWTRNAKPCFKFWCLVVWFGKNKL